MNRCIVAWAVAGGCCLSCASAARADDHAFTGEWIQSRIDGWIAEAARAQGTSPEKVKRVEVPGGEIRLRRGTYVVRRPIDCRGIWGIRIVGEGRATRIVPRFSPADSHKPLFDCTGATRGYFGHLL